MFYWLLLIRYVQGLSEEEIYEAAIRAEEEVASKAWELEGKSSRDVNKYVRCPFSFPVASLVAKSTLSFQAQLSELDMCLGRY